MKFSIGRIFRAAIFLTLAGTLFAPETGTAATISDLEGQADSALTTVQNGVAAEAEADIRQGLRDARAAARQALPVLRAASPPTRQQFQNALNLARSVVQAARAGARHASDNENAGLAGDATDAGDAGLDLLAELLVAAREYGDLDLAAGIAEGLDQLGEAINFAAIQARRERNTALGNQILGVVDRLIPNAESAALFPGGEQRADLAVPAISALGNVAEAATHLREATKGLANVRVHNAPGIRVKTIAGALNQIQRAFGPNAPDAVKAALTAARRQIGRNDFKFGPPENRGRNDDTSPASPI